MRGHFQSTTEAQEYIHNVLGYICDVSWFLELVLINLAILRIFAEPWVLYTLSIDYLWPNQQDSENLPNELLQLFSVGAVVAKRH